MTKYAIVVNEAGKVPKTVVGVSVNDKRITDTCKSVYVLYLNIKVG